MISIKQTLATETVDNIYSECKLNKNYSVVSLWSVTDDIFLKSEGQKV